MTPRNILDQEILCLSTLDRVKFAQTLQGGTLITGGLGAGKSTTSGRAFCHAFLRAGLGGFFTCVKSEDAETYISYAKECGREKDLIIFSEKSGLTFDPLAYMWSMPGRGGGDAENIIDYFSTLLSIGKQHVGVNNDRFWELASEKLMRVAIHLIKLSKTPLSIVNIHRVIESLPTIPGEYESEQWQNESYCASLINAIRVRKDELTQEEWSDLDVATHFAFKVWPTYDEKPRSSIAMTFTGMSDKFLYNPLKRLFASGTFDFTPEQTTHERKIVIVDFPVLEYGRETARLIQILVKLTFQRAWLRHKFTPGCCNGAFLIMDEFQMLIHKQENHFVQVCRSSGIAVVCMTQTILNLAEELGESQPGSKTKAFLNNLAIKIAHNSTCPDTCNYMADVIGKEYRYVENYSSGGAQQQSTTSVGGSLQLVHILESIEFTRLMTPDSDNPCAEAIVYMSGKTFNATRTAKDPKGKNYLRVLFSRES